MGILCEGKNDCRAECELFAQQYGANPECEAYLCACHGYTGLGWDLWFCVWGANMSGNPATPERNDPLCCDIDPLSGYCTDPNKHWPPVPNTPTGCE
jgi:hypothetical protein